MLPSTHEPAGFFVLLAPAMPLERLQAACTPNLQGCDAVLQAWLREHWVQATLGPLPEVGDGLARWLQEPSAQTFAEIRTAAIRYLLRMTTRSCPVLLFASFSSGTLGATARLDLGSPENLQRHSMASVHFLRTLLARTVAQPAVRRQVRFTVNPTLTRHAAGWQYIEETWERDAPIRTLVSIDDDALAGHMIASCAPGCSFETLAMLARAQVTEATVEEADAYVNELIESQLLVPELGVNLTGEHPVRRLIALSDGCRALQPFNAAVRETADALSALDRGPVEELWTGYRARNRANAEAAVAHPQIAAFNIVLRRDAPRLQFPVSVAADILEAVETLRQITPIDPRQRALDRFRERFRERFGDAWVDLASALDEATGIGFDRVGQGEDLADPTNAPPPEAGNRDARRDRLRELAARQWRPDQDGMDLGDDDLADLCVRNALPLPDVYTVTGALLAPAAGDAARSARRFAISSVHAGIGPIGQYCRSDPDLESATRSLLRKEEALRPDAVFAEFVHLVNDRTGDMAVRPSLRPIEMPYLGISGLEARRQIRLADLTVGVRANRIVLRSRSLDREIIAQTSCAQFVTGVSSTVQSFIVALAAQNASVRLAFSWGAELENAPRLPRITRGGAILSPASWRVDREWIAAWTGLPQDQRLEPIRALRAAQRIPRWVCVGAVSIQVALDLENPLCLDVLATELAYGPSHRLREMLPSPEQTCVTSDQGHHVGEFLIPFVRKSGRER